MCVTLQWLRSTCEGGAVKALQAQFLTVQMSREVLEEGGGASYRNITGAVYQHLNTCEVKEKICVLVCFLM